MNLAIEYLIRSGLAREALTLPCSLFLNSKENEKLVITISKRIEKYTIKHWEIFNCGNDQALPSMKDYTSENMFSDLVIPSGFHPLHFEEQPVPTEGNTWREPMSTNKYIAYTNNFPSSENHKIIREVWLWKAFAKIYDPPRSKFTHSFLPIYAPSSPQYYLKDCCLKRLQTDSKNKCPQYWKCWLMWRKHMLDSYTPGELAFINCH